MWSPLTPKAKGDGQSKDEQLIHWIKYGHLRELHYFIRKLTDVNKTIFNDTQNNLNLLHITASIDSAFTERIINILLKTKNIDVNVYGKVNGTSVTAAHIASMWGHDTTLTTLVNNGCDPFLADSHGNDAFVYASDYDQYKCIKVLNQYYDNAFNRTLKVSHIKPHNGSVNNNVNISSNDMLTLSLIDLENCSGDGIDKSMDSLINNLDAMQLSNTKKLHNKSLSEPQIDKRKINNSHDDVEETHIYYDNDYGITLIEEKLQTGEVINDVNHSLMKLNDSEIMNRLKAKGYSPGPITGSTKKLYINLLSKRITPEIVATNLPLQGYCEEINSVIQNAFPFEDARRLENFLIQHYEAKSGTSKKIYFTYLLLDPNYSQNIPLEANKIHYNHEYLIENLFPKFIKSIFYVGKGQGTRPYMHLYEAAEYISMIPERMKMSKPKILRIHQIWNSDRGVISLQGCDSISNKEALTRETLMINTLGLENLTNIIRGDKTDISKLKWNDRKKRLCGTYFLFKAFMKFLYSGERQIRYNDAK